MTEYELLRSVTPTTFDSSNPYREVKLNLTGNMERYTWSFNNKVLSEESKILIRKGETVRFVLENTTMMHHPIHLHGHFFRVLNGQGDYSPLKHTVNVPPMQTVIIEFFANEEKDWFFHCHNLYHMKAGMTRVISYEETTQVDSNSLAKLFTDKHWFHFVDLTSQSSFTSVELRSENTRNAFALDFDWGYQSKYEVELVYERSITRFLNVYAGAEINRLEDSKQDKAIVGFNYILPLLVQADIRVDSHGVARLGLSSELQLTDRVSFDWNVNTHNEYTYQLEYEVNKRFSFIASRDEEFEWGLGVMFKY